MSKEATPFGRMLNSARTAQGMTMCQLALEAGLSFGYISQIERGFAKPPSVQYIKKLADALQISREELYEVAGEKAPATEAFIRDIYKHLKRADSMSLSEFLATATRYELVDDRMALLP